MNGNREYKSDVFSMLFEDPQNAMDAYNGLNNSCYMDPDLVEIKKLESGIALSVRNDASFILDSSLNIYEHQSSVCPNMPLRSLIYMTELLRDYLGREELYGSRLIRIPTPRFAVFYNGKQEQPEQVELRLSDAFLKQTDEPELELKCTLYNINEGYNLELMNKCIVLREYMQFVNIVRANVELYGKNQLDLALDMAIDTCINQGILREFLSKRKDEVRRAMEWDWTYERRLELAKLAEFRAGKKAGIKIGEAKVLLPIICRKLREGHTTAQIEEYIEEFMGAKQDLEVIFDLAKDYAPDYPEDAILEQVEIIYQDE